jgi:hypothetical protein
VRVVLLWRSLSPRPWRLPDLGMVMIGPRNHHTMPRYLFWATMSQGMSPWSGAIPPVHPQKPTGRGRVLVTIQAELRAGTNFPSSQLFSRVTVKPRWFRGLHGSCHPRAASMISRRRLDDLDLCRGAEAVFRRPRQSATPFDESRIRSLTNSAKLNRDSHLFPL